MSVELRNEIQQHLLVAANEIDQASTATASQKSFWSVRVAPFIEACVNVEIGLVDVRRMANTHARVCGLHPSIENLAVVTALAVKTFTTDEPEESTDEDHRISLSVVCIQAELVRRN